MMLRPPRCDRGCCIFAAVHRPSRVRPLAPICPRQLVEDATQAPGYAVALSAVFSCARALSFSYAARDPPPSRSGRDERTSITLRPRLL